MAKLKYTITALLMAVLSSCGGPTGDGAGLVARNAWVRSAPPGTHMTAAYGEFINKTGRDMRFSAWSSPDYRDVSLHRTEMEDGVSRMRSAGEVVVVAGGSVELEPGGLHLMLMGPQRDIVEGDTVTLVLTDGESKQHELKLAVERK